MQAPCNSGSYNCVCGRVLRRYPIKCVVCEIDKYIDITDKDEIKENFCPIHRVIKICGNPMPVCETCKEQGWINRFGHGGPPENHNKITGETYRLIYDQKTEEYRKPSQTS